MELTIAPEYGYVLLTSIVGGMLVNMFLVFNLGKARKRFNIQYPTVYSPDNQVFNCYQRAHLNYVEALPMFLIPALIAGTMHPVVVSVLNVIYLAGRVAYALGYYTGKADARLRGGFGYIGFFGNLLLTIHVALSLLGVV